MIQEIRDHLLEAKDMKFRAWLFENYAPPPLLSSTIEFGDSFKIYLIDHYSGRAPTYLSYHTIKENRPVGLMPMAVLDSQTVSLLTQYVQAPEILIGSKAESARALVVELVQRGFDYNPFFYYLESAAKNKDGTLSEYALQSAKAIITLHTMDEERFLKEGTVVVDEHLLEPYKERYGCQTIEEIAYHNSQFMIKGNTLFSIDDFVDVTYIMILKMGLIHRQSSKGVLKKAIELRNFMENELGTYLGREAQIAWFYFADLLNKFLPLQKNSKYPEILSKLRATAWDILLLRLPELMLGWSNGSEAILMYVCTSEKALSRLGKAFQILAIQTMPPDYTMQPVLITNLSELQSKIGKDAVSKLAKENETWQQERQGKKLLGQVQPAQIFSFDRVKELIEELEYEVKIFCQR